MDSNHRRYKPADLQSAPFGHSGIRPLTNLCPIYIISLRNRKKIMRTFSAERLFLFWASCRIRTNDPEITNHVLWPTELKRHISIFSCIASRVSGSNAVAKLRKVFKSPNFSRLFFVVFVIFFFLTATNALFRQFYGTKNGAKEPDAHRAGPCGTEFYDSMNRPPIRKKDVRLR